MSLNGNAYPAQGQNQFLPQEKKSNKGKVIAIVAAIVAVVAIAVTAGILIASGNTLKRLQRQIDLGNRYLSELQYDQAVIAFEEALRIDPKSAEAYGGLILANAERGDMTAAADVYKKAEEVLTAIELQRALGRLDIQTTEEVRRISAGGETPSGSSGTVTAVPETSGSAADAGDTSADGLFSGAGNASVGDTITFGTYEQDGNQANGAEPIEWIVLDEDAEKVLVISRYVLDCIPYNEEYADITWEDSPLRSWLNNTFYHSAFSVAEQATIRETNVVNSGNEYWGTPGGNDTRDKVFLLSVDEIYRYYDFNAVNEEDSWRASEQLITEPTPYAENGGVSADTIDQLFFDNYGKEVCNYPISVIGRVGAWWWLRSPGYLSDIATVVASFGYVGWDYGIRVDGGYYGGGVRPALWISR